MARAGQKPLPVRPGPELAPVAASSKLPSATFSIRGWMPLALRPLVA